MKTGHKIAVKTVDQAQADLESAVRQIVKSAEWVNPYSVAGRQYRAPINQLRQPLVELDVARREEKRRSTLKEL